MNKIPKIIHQIWGGEKELPKSYQILSETWRRDYPDWQYEFWDDKRINEFVLKNYPEYYDQFLAFPHNNSSNPRTGMLLCFRSGNSLRFPTESMDA